MAAYVHVGQCGSQLGAAYWQLVGKEDDLDATTTTTAKKTQQGSKSRRLPSAPAAGGKLSASTVPPLFFHHFYYRPSRKARCILVDTEPKVIRSILGTDDTRISSSRAFFQPAFVHLGQSGRGNNWAMGYNFQRFQSNVIPSKTETMQPAAPAKSRHARAKLTPFDDDKRELVELVMDSLQRLVETTDCFQGTVLMHSLGGGTGSGLGCRLMELIRDTYPRSYLVAASVAPSWKCGDTPLQNYNSVFTLAHLQEHADCVIYKENDELLRTAGYWKALQSQQQQDQSQHLTDNCGASAGQASQQHRVSIDELNHLAAADLAGLLFPMTSQSRITSMSPVAKPFDFGKLLHDLCPMSSAKFLDVRTGILKAKAQSKTNTKGWRIHSSTPASAHFRF